MKDLELGIYPGSYSISLDEVETFWRLYYDYVFVKRRNF
jgi:hypothetical protein